MAQTIKLKRSATAGNTPTTSQLALGELGINTTDGKLFLKKSVSGTESIVDVGGLPLTGGTLTGNLSLSDNVKAQFGASNDLQIYHDGTASYVEDAGTGNLRIKTNGVGVQVLDGSDLNLAVFNAGNGQSQLYNVTGGASTLRLATSSYGIDITGRLVTTSHIDAPDNARIRLGDGDDLQIYHDGSNSYISDQGTGNLRILGDEVLIANAANNEFKAVFNSNGAASLYYDGSPKLATTSTGIDVTGSVVADLLTTDDDVSGLTTLGRYSSGFAYSLLRPSASATGLEIRTNAGNALAHFLNDGTTKLHHNGSPKLATKATGADINGVLTADGLTVDGESDLNATITITHANPRIKFIENNTTNANTQFSNDGGDFAISTMNDAESTFTKRFKPRPCHW